MCERQRNEDLTKQKRRNEELIAFALLVCLLFPLLRPNLSNVDHQYRRLPNYLGTDLFLHPRIDHHISALDTLRPTLEPPMCTLRNDDLDLFPLLHLHSLLHEFLDLPSFLPLRHIGRLVDTLRFLHGLFELLRSLELLACLRLRHLLDRPGVQSAHLGTEGGDGLLGDRDVGLVVLLLVVEEPGGQAVLGIEGVAVKAVVD